MEVHIKSEHPLGLHRRPDVAHHRGIGVLVRMFVQHAAYLDPGGIERTVLVARTRNQDNILEELK